MKTVIKLNALDKDSSGAFSSMIEVNSVEDFRKAEQEFEGKVPFSRFYYDHEYLRGNEALANQCIDE